ncbi:caspase, EACC1-associated type [Streptomyces albidoflavus]|uniref:caspase, EACC1-associated type n=1 Tax=Streptomyces albidoflavus TaxID=1886 RepID=UPI0002494568
MTTSPFGTGNRGALLIGTGTYDHQELPDLRSPEVDCTRLGGLLRDPKIGAFEVQTLIDADRATLERAIGEFFHLAWGDDLRLLYLSGHGIVSPRSDKLHFAIRQTDPARPAYTTISAAFIHEVMDECRARSIVVILDCCYSGLFLPGAKGDEPARFEEELAGHGRVVLTAGTRSQRVWEGQHLDTGPPAPSLFTGMLIEGMSSGAADLNGDGVVTLQELYRFAYERLHQEGAAQTPRMGGEMQYDIPLAKVRKRRKSRPPRTGGTGSRNRGSGAPARPRPEPWQRRAAFGPARQPVLSDGMLVVHEPYHLHALTLESRQRAPLIRMPYPGSPALHEGAAYFPGKGGHLHMADLRTGRRRASRPVAVRDASLGIANGVLYATVQDGTLHAFSLSTLSPLWSLPADGLTVASAPRASAGYTLFTASAARLPQDEPANGADRVVAVVEGETAWCYQAEAPLSPDWAVTDHGIYLALQPETRSPHQQILALNPADGQLVWSFRTKAPLATALAATDEVVLFGDEEHRLVALDAKTGIPRWDKERKTGGRLLTRPALSGGSFFTADRTAKLTRWNLSTGRKVRAHDLLVSPDRAGSLAIRDGVVHATDARGGVHAVPL